MKIKFFSQTILTLGFAFIAGFSGFAQKPVTEDASKEAT